jgi:hypothetical protein
MSPGSLLREDGSLEVVMRRTALLLLAVLAGCTDQEHLGPGGYYIFAMTDATPAFIEGENGAAYRVEYRVELPIEAPTPEQMAALEAAGPQGPFPRMPWVERNDVFLELDYVISNLADAEIRVRLGMNGFNEFHEYMPGAVIVDDEVVEDFNQYEREWELEPYERRYGTIREEDIDEIAVDLATVVNGAPNANQVVHFQNHSDHDPRSQMYVPAVIPGLTGFRMALNSTAPVNVAVEFSLRARDEGGRIVDVQNAWVLPVPAPFMPSMYVPP